MNANEMNELKLLRQAVEQQNEQITALAYGLQVLLEELAPTSYNARCLIHSLWSAQEIYPLRLDTLMLEVKDEILWTVKG